VVSTGLQQISWLAQGRVHKLKRRGLRRCTGATQVLERIKEPLQTLMSRDHYETAYAVLAHFLLLAQRAPSLFSQARCHDPGKGLGDQVCRVLQW